MKAGIEHNNDKAANAIGANQADFNFELWVKQVRPQLLASVQKRGVK